MESKPFWKSRKFGYALGTLLASLAVALLSSIEGVSPDVQAALAQFLPTIMVMGVLLITGHTITDVVALWRDGVAGKELKDAIIELIDAILEPDDEDIIEAAPVAEG
jgi:hypothetical protein